jgi:hypothetical protein
MALAMLIAGESGFRYHVLVMSRGVLEVVVRQTAWLRHVVSKNEMKLQCVSGLQILKLEIPTWLLDQDLRNSSLSWD